MSMSLYDKDYYNGNYRIKIAAYYLKNWENYRMQFHSHDRVEIMYVTKGRCTIDVKQDKFKLVSGDMILVDANVAHRIIMEEGEQCRMLNIEFHFEHDDTLPSIGMMVGKKFLTTKLFSEAREYIIFKDGSDMYTYLNLIVGELSGDASDAVIQLQAAQILIKLAGMYETLHSSKRVKTVVYVNRALNYINTHYHENIQAHDIAQHAGVNKNYLQRRFKESTGKTMSEYLSEKRMEKAKQLLEKTDIPIIDLCLYVGINSRQYFTAVFTKRMGMSPQKYRQSFINSSWE